ncbi:hypothetical protein COCOBI_09-5600 [Coccomyxa sp. Obi]|nr:hypothetical protein COCOBI_09-5600 [Coccomyxa sp. Obi]
MNFLSTELSKLLIVVSPFPQGRPCAVHLVVHNRNLSALSENCTVGDRPGIQASNRALGQNHLTVCHKGRPHELQGMTERAR